MLQTSSAECLDSETRWWKWLVIEEAEITECRSPKVLGWPVWTDRRHSFSTNLCFTQLSFDVYGTTAMKRDTLPISLWVHTLVVWMIMFSAPLFIRYEMKKPWAWRYFQIGIALLRIDSNSSLSRSEWTTLSVWHNISLPQFSSFVDTVWLCTFSDRIMTLCTWATQFCSHLSSWHQLHNELLTLFSPYPSVICQCWCTCSGQILLATWSNAKARIISPLSEFPHSMILSWPRNVSFVFFNNGRKNHLCAVHLISSSLRFRSVCFPYVFTSFIKKATRNIHFRDRARNRQTAVKQRR